MDYYVLADKPRRNSSAHCASSWQTRSGSQNAGPAGGPVT